MPPETIAGRYRVVREAGRGGMGAVWLCTDELLGREVAVKQIGHLPTESAPDLARALREARSSAALNHPNVVAVFDAIEEGDHVWLVMEYVEGRTLSQLVREEGPLPPRRAAAIGAQVADGLTAAHRRGTVHRDVKPGNILIADGDLAKISDFGIARTLGDEQLTQTGMLTGTPAYFSPELARGEDPTPASDVWALGATLYSAVEGSSPFPERANALAMLSEIAEGTPPPPRQAGPLADPLRRMMDPDPSARMSMAEAADLLRRVAAEPAPSETSERTVAFAAPAPVPEPAPEPETTAAEEVVPPPAPPPAPVSDDADDADDADDDRPTRRGAGVALLVLGLVALAVIVVGGLVLLLGDGSDEPDPAAQPETSQKQKPSQTATREEEPEPEETAEEPEETTSSPPAETPPASTGGGSRSGFVEDYYAVLPEDTDAGWSMLSPDYQAGTSFEEYDGFWSTIDDVTVDDTAPAGGGAVDVTITYAYDGTTEQEVRRIYLERGESGYLIADDEAVG